MVRLQGKRFRFGPLLLLALLAVIPAFTQPSPIIEELSLISHLPKELPQRVGAIAFDGSKFWLPIYLDHGRYVTFDPKTGVWDIRQSIPLRQAITKVAGSWTSPGGMVFVGDKLWLSSSYGDAYGWIDLNEPNSFRKFERRYRSDYPGSQSYSDLTYDGKYLWAFWKSFFYSAGRSKTHLLLKIDPNTGEILSEASIPFGNPASGVRGLTWDGIQLWVGAGNRLFAIDESGTSIRSYKLPGVNKIAGLAFVDDCIWIAEFGGKIWKVPVR